MTDPIVRGAPARPDATYDPTHTTPTTTAAIQKAQAQTRDGAKIGSVDWTPGHETLLEMLDRSHRAGGELPADVARYVRENAGKLAGSFTTVGALNAVSKSAMEAALSALEAPRFLSSPLQAVGVGSAAVVVGGAGAIAASVRQLHVGDELQRAAQRDAIDQVVLTDASFDPEYVAAQRQRMGGAGSVKHLLARPAVQTQLAETKRQLDVGRSEALQAARYPGGPAAYLTAHPEVARALQSDVAFCHGWQEVLFFAAQHRGDKLEAIGRQIDERLEAELPPQCPRDFGSPVRG